MQRVQYFFEPFLGNQGTKSSSEGANADSLLTHDEHCGHACTAILYVKFCGPSKKQSPPG